MQLRRWGSGALAVAGGLLMLGSGYVSHSILYLALGYAQSQIPNFLAGTSETLTSLAVAVLEFMVTFGGATVAAGGLALLAGHRTTGRALLFLGGGAGFLGVAVSFGLAAFNLGIGAASSYAGYWLGVVLAVIARSLARGM